jgi:formylglycine-generating enzyme required for sulfatase activity
MKFTWIPAGTFLMGSGPEEGKRGEDEVQHKVTLSRWFYLAIYPSTQASWRAVMGNNLSWLLRWLPHCDFPVEQVTWDDCQEFIRRLGDREGHTRLAVHGMPA